MRVARPIMVHDAVRPSRAFRPRAMRTAIAFLGLLLATSTHAGECSVRSGDRTTALVELYTSEGCSSCPPADRWLSGLGARGYVPARVAPLSLHVDYWDYIGWKDPYAKREFSGRQRKLTQLQRLAFVYTPQVILQGRDFRGWRTAAFDREVERINATPAKARLEIEIIKVKRDALAVHAHAELLPGASRKEAALYLAAYENKLTSKVTAGENRGQTLGHDYVVLEWLGPFSLDAEGRRAERRDLPLLPKAVPDNSGVAAFVQDRGTLEVLQSLMLGLDGPDCPAGKG